MPLSSYNYLIVYIEPGVIFERDIERFTFSANKLIEIVLKRLSLQLWTFFKISYFLFKSFVKVELSYAFTINMFTKVENCTLKWIIF